MSGLVAMIVLSYLLVIAICVAFWSAASLLRESPEQARAGESLGASRGNPTGGDRTDGREGRSRRHDATHDAYRGARAKERRAAADNPVPDPAPDAPPTAKRSEATKPPRIPRETPTAHRPELPRESGAGPVRTDGIRVTESRRTRDRKAEEAAREETGERSPKEDPFERFLRANEDFER